MIYSRQTLPNGCRLISTSIPTAQSVGINVFVGTGSRNETEETNGLSHFLEHLVFKGTQNYPSSRAVSESIEGLGGVLNGYTSESLTNYWCKVTPEHFGQAFDVVASLVCQPLLREEDIEEERGVVIEEINRKEDNPQDKIFDNINQVTFSGHPLSFSVLGQAENIRSMRRLDFEAYRKSYYRAGNLVVSVAGKIKEAEVLSSFSQTFGRLEGLPALDLKTFRPKRGESPFFLETKETEQAYFCLSLRGLNLRHRDRFKLFLLNSLLGSGMSSRLFINIREKGLAYWVGSAPDLMIDTGALLVYAGFNVGRIKEALAAVLGELGRLKEEPVGLDEFNKAKEKLKGPLLFQLEDPNELAEWYGKQEVMKGEIETETDYLARIDRLQPQDIRDLARDLFCPENLNLAIIGPYSKSYEEELTKLLKI